jgi:hypothetical protein
MPLVEVGVRHCHLLLSHPWSWSSRAGDQEDVRDWEVEDCLVFGRVVELFDPEGPVVGVDLFQLAEVLVQEVDLSSGRYIMCPIPARTMMSMMDSSMDILKLLVLLHVGLSLRSFWRRHGPGCS